MQDPPHVTCVYQITSPPASIVFIYFNQYNNSMSDDSDMNKDGGKTVNYSWNIQTQVGIKG